MRGRGGWRAVRFGLKDRGERKETTTNQTAEAGPPRSIGVLNVVAIEEHMPMMLNADLKVQRDDERKIGRYAVSCLLVAREASG